ncbi:MAG: N-acetylneuraminate synthase family protein [Deltaproteobacteria bacterium]|jgi:sialic acid synthase SpsE|nr:N-acetylneuraminate synthase family protein [Deltaproteobacteria bacterium]
MYNLPKFIAEVGLNHNGDLEIAKKMIAVAAANHCDYVKFQKRTVGLIATNDVLDAEDGRFPAFGKTYRAIREHHEFNFEQYLEIIEYCKLKGVAFLCTAFDVEAVDFLEQCGVSAYKIASHNITDLPLLKKIARLKKRTFLSTGMCLLEEIDEAVAIFREENCELILMHCVSSYPSDNSEANLAIIPFLKQRYQDCVVGYSGHEENSIISEYAAVLGAAYIERHITLDRTMPGFDHKISLDPAGLKELLERLKIVCSTMGRAEKKISEKEMITRNKYRRSIVASRHLKKGERVSEDMFAMKNPGTGLAPRCMYALIGKTVKEDIPVDTLVTVAQFE